MIRQFHLYCLLLLTACMYSQTPIGGVVNLYTPVTNINLVTNTFMVGSSAGFAIGDRVLVMQMKGATINQTNTAAYGDLISTGDAGNYEFNTVCNISGTDIQLKDTLKRTYSVAGSVQLIRVPVYTNAVVTAPLTASPWNGSSGGVIVLEVTGTLTLNASVNASGAGFIGGSEADNFFNAGMCMQTNYFFPTSGNQLGGRKGEGIAALVVNQELGRGKLANGGGGGNHTNSGGGGGGNGGTGGLGGLEWGGCSGASIGGVGGLSLTYSNALNRVYLGGGGGEGHHNDSNTPAAGNGGGIILINAGTLVSNGFQFVSNGSNAAAAGIDGGSGGGAGGAVVLSVSAFSDPVNVSVQGGTGANSSNNHGSGGGGAGGAFWFAGASLPAGSTVVLSGGSGGTDGGVRNGQPGSAGVQLSGLVLPVSGGQHAACTVLADGLGLLASRLGNEDYVTLFGPQIQSASTIIWTCSFNGRDFTPIGQGFFIAASGSSVSARFPARSGDIWYQGITVDAGGQYSFSNVVMVSGLVRSVISGYPNPVRSGEFVYFSLPESVEDQLPVEVLAADGRNVYSGFMHRTPGGEYFISTMELAPGFYQVVCTDIPGGVVKLVIQ